MEINEIKNTFCEVFYLNDPNVIDVTMGCVVANSTEEGDSVNLHLIGPPSTAKTELLGSLRDHPKIYHLATLTPQTLISGFKQRKFNPQKSLLLKLQGLGKTAIVIKDFTTVLELRSEARQEILSQIREISDGFYKKAFGTGEEVSWTGKLAFLTGVTQLIDVHHSVKQILGERFLYYRISVSDPESVAEMAMKNAGREKEIRTRIREKVNLFLDQFKNPKMEEITINGDINSKIINLSCFVATARTGVSRDRMTQNINYKPEPEGPGRLAKQIITLGRGVTIIHGKNGIDEEVYKILKKVGKDCLPSNRNLVLEKMWDLGIRGGVWEKTKDISECFHYPVTTTKLQLEDLMVLGLVERRLDNIGGGATAPYLWTLSDRCCELIRLSEVY